jgi:hypothetical protein
MIFSHNAKYASTGFSDNGRMIDTVETRKQGGQEDYFPFPDTNRLSQAITDVPLFDHLGGTVRQRDQS